MAAFKDVYPSAPGHTLVIPRRHVGRILELTDAEHTELWAVTRLMMSALEALHPDAYTMVNDGQAAGQSVPHMHLHIIGHHGDTEEPLGWVRWVLPASAPYWNQPPR